MSVIQLLTVAERLFLGGFLATSRNHRNDAMNCGHWILVYPVVMQWWVSVWKWKPTLKVSVYSQLCECMKCFVCLFANSGMRFLIISLVIMDQKYVQSWIDESLRIDVFCNFMKTFVSEHEIWYLLQWWLQYDLQISHVMLIYVFPYLVLNNM